MSGNPSKAAKQVRDELYWRDVREQTVPPYRSPATADWEQLEQVGRAKYPECPDCGGRLLSGDGEEGADDEGNTVISMSLSCEHEDPDDPAAQRPHPVSGGFIELEATLRLPPAAR